MWIIFFYLYYHLKKLHKQRPPAQRVVLILIFLITYRLIGTETKLIDNLVIDKDRNIRPWEFKQTSGAKILM